MEFPNSILDLQNEVEEGISKFEEIVLDFEDPNDIENFHTNLKLIKNNLDSIKEELNKKKFKIEIGIKDLENIYERNRIKLEKLNYESNQILENLKNISNTIRNNIIEKAKNKYLTSVEIPELYASNIIVDLILSNTNFFVETIVEEKAIYTKVDEIQTIINVVDKTSLDLLMIMDTTCSMNPYIKQVQQNLLNIINKIVLECPGVDLNIGFVGYKDVNNEGPYTNLNFTQNYQELKQTINNINPTCG